MRDLTENKSWNFNFVWLKVVPENKYLHYAKTNHISWNCIFFCNFPKPQKLIRHDFIFFRFIARCTAVCMTNLEAVSLFSIPWTLRYSINAASIQKIIHCTSKIIFYCCQISFWFGNVNFISSDLMCFSWSIVSTLTTQAETTGESYHLTFHLSNHLINTNKINNTI